MLKDDHIRQACDYGSNAGIEWIALTNGNMWKIYKIIFSKPVESELIYEFDFTQLSPKRQTDLEMLYYISRESLTKTSSNLLQEFADQRQILNHFFVGQLLLSDPVLDAIRKQLRKMAPDTKVSTDEIKIILASEVIKRDVFEGEKSDEAKKQLLKYQRQAAKQKAAPAVKEDKQEA